MRSFLERKEVDAADVEYALGELRDAGAVDDARFARLFAEDKRGIDGWGAARVDQELRRRGVPDHLAELERGRHDRDEELRAAVTLLSEKMAPATDDRQRDKAWRMLVRKGYEPELAYSAVREHSQGSRTT